MKKLVSKLKIGYAIYIALLLALSLTGCASTKKLEKMKSDIALNADVESKKKTDETTNIKTAASGETAVTKNTESTENQSKETETKKTVYDTSKPIVPGTGKPPVAEESTTTERETSNKDNKIIEETLSKNNLLVEENKRLKQTNDSLLSIKAKENTKAETKVTPVNNWWKWTIFGIIIGIILTVLVFHFKFHLYILKILKSLFSFFCLI